MKLLVENATLRDTFMGKTILGDGTSTFLYATELTALGTQKIYGRNGIQIVAKKDDDYFIVRKSWNTRFARVLEKFLPTKREHSSGASAVSIIWGAPEIFSAAIDKWAGIK